MSHIPQLKIPATYMRGGTRKGTFFKLGDLPASAKPPGFALYPILFLCLDMPTPYV